MNIKTGPAALIFLLSLNFCTAAQSEQSFRSNDTIKSVVAELIKGARTDTQKMERIYYFVRDEIKFGWVYPQEVPPEEVLNKRKGVCMQKTNLLAAMAREAGIKARFHFMYVRKTALEDFLPDFAYKKWVDPFPHTFAEVYLNEKWVSMEATFDRELHNICIRKELNFGKNAEIVKAVSIEFSPDGVKGHQQYFQADGKESFYGEDLSEFTKFMHDEVPWWKKMLQPMIFKKAQKNMDKIRSSN